jgi:hypothetical protein
VGLIIPLSSRAHELYKYINWLLSRNISDKEGYYWLCMDLGQLTDLFGENLYKENICLLQEALA